MPVSSIPSIQSPYGTRDAVYEHPMLRYLSNLIPRRLKSLFKLCEQVFMGPHASSGIRKIAEYPVTDPELFSENENDKTIVAELFKNVFHIKREITKSMYNLFVYGNDFVSFHKPFLRMVECQKCGSKYSIKKLKSFKYHYQSVTISYKCPGCKQGTIGKFHDIKVDDISKCSIIHWDPKRITISHNPISKESEYYYEPTPEMVSRIQNGDRHLICTLPKSMLETIKLDTHYQFDHDQIYHMKVDAPAGLENESGWGIPVLISAIETFFYISLLRKGNESVALERVESFRILFPGSTSPTNDGSYAMSMAKHSGNLKEAYAAWRRGDRNQIFFSPIPVGQVEVGGNARALLTHQEIIAAEDNMLALIGVPREFIYGGMPQGAGTGSFLRQIENQLVAHISQTSGLLQWLTNKITAFKGMGEVKARLGKFTVQDDNYNKQAALMLFERGELSAESFAKIYGFVREEEQDRIEEETLDRARRQMSIDKKMQALQNDIVMQAEAQANSEAGLGYNPNAVMAKAQMYVDQMLSDPSISKSLHAQLQNTDMVMYSVVRTLWEQQTEMMQRQGGMAPPQGM